MKVVVEFVRSTILGGLLFLVPLVAVLFVLGEAFKIARTVLAPVAQLFPFHPIAGVTGATLVAVAGLVLVCFLAGLIARTVVGRAIAEPLERTVLRRVPGYAFVRTVTRGLAGLQGDKDVVVALAWIEESWVLSFVLERHTSGLHTVFVPSAPTPAAGAVYYLPADRLRMLDVPVAKAVASIMSLGMGSRELLEGISIERSA